MAILSPSLFASAASVLQWTPAILRPWEMFDASLLSSPTTVSGGSPAGAKYGIKAAGLFGSGTTGFLMSADSSKNAFNIVTQAPATVACVTMLKAFFDESALIKNPVVPDPDRK